MKKYQNILPFVLIVVLVSAVICYSQELKSEGEASKTVEVENEKKNTAPENLKEAPAVKEVDESTQTQKKETSSGNASLKKEEQKAAVQQPASGETSPEDTDSNQVKESGEKTAASTGSGKDAASVQQTGKGSSILKKGLLSIEDETYKFSRIPGLASEKRPVPGHAETIADVKDQTLIHENLTKKDVEKSKGLWGMSKERTDFLIKGSLLFLIVVIFILYRLRSKGQNKTVLRSFPKR